MSIIVDQNSAGNIPDPSSGSSTIFIDQTGQLAVKQANGTSGSIPTVSSSNTQVIYNDQGNLAGSSSLTFNENTGTLSASVFSGDGSNLSNITGANVGGIVGYANYTYNISGSNVSGPVGQATYATTANSVAGSNVSGTVSSATTAGTVTASAQPNITSVGTLTTLSVGGNIDVTGNINVTGNLNYANVTDLIVTDPLIYVAANNAGDLVDIGLVGSYVQNSYVHTGIARNHINDTWTFFDGVAAEPTTEIDWANATYPNVKSGNFSSTGNVTAGYFIGNGSQLTGLSTYSISNGTSNVVVSSSANVNISSAGTANVVAVSNTGATVSGTLIATGQTSLGGVAGSESFRATVVASQNRYVEVRGGVSGTTYPAIGVGGGTEAFGVYSNLNIIRFGTQGYNSGLQMAVSHTANAVNYIQVTGAATGANPTISSQGSDANAGLTLQSKGTFGFTFRNGSNGIIGAISHSGSATPNYLQLAATVSGSAPSLTSAGADANIDLTLSPKGTSNVTTAANVVVGGLITATGNVRGANLVTPGIVSATGNVSASYFIGNGSLLTGLSGSSLTNGNSNVIVNANSSVNISSGGTANVLVIATTGATVTGLVTATGNIRGANLVTPGVLSVTGNANIGNIGVTEVTATGNISANNFVATGSSGNITGANVIFANSVTLTGNVSSGGLTSANAVFSNFGAANAAVVGLGDSNTGLFRPAANTLGFTTSGVQRMAINAGAPILCLSGGNASATGTGIAFPAAQSASSDPNTLDDYEEGTFSPTFLVAGANTSVTMTTQNGSYVKIGRFVFISMVVSGSYSGAGTGIISVGNLPFTNNQGFDATPSIGYTTGWTSGSSTVPKGGYMGTGTNNIQLVTGSTSNYQTAELRTATQGTSIATNSAIQLTIGYSTST